jgi:hypothetical protein
MLEGIKMKLLVLSQGKLEFMHLNSESRDWQNSMKKERIGYGRRKLSMIAAKS